MSRVTAAETPEVLRSRESEVGKSLAAKLANVAQEIDRVAKRGRNREQGYNFATAGDIFDEIRGKLAGQRVAMRWAVDRENSKLDPVESKNGAKGLFATLWITYTFVDGDDGTAWDYYTVGTANDYPGDKAVYKAQTNALKYLLTQTFLVSTGADVESSEQEASASYTRREPQQRPASSRLASTPQVAQPAITPDDQIPQTLQDLAGTLPRAWFGRKLLAKVASLGPDKVLVELLDEHLAQCGAACTHVPQEATANEP